MKKGVKYYVAKGIIGMGKEGVDEGIRCDLIKHAFRRDYCISGDSRLRHELKNEYTDTMIFEITTNRRKQYNEPYEYKNKRYYIHKTFLIWLRKVYGRVE